MFPSDQQPIKVIPESFRLFLICDPAFVFRLEEFPGAGKRTDGIKAEIKEAAEEKPIKELAESSRPRTETEKTERGKQKNGDCTTSHPCRSASEAAASALAASEVMELIIFPPTHECFHLALKLNAQRLIILSLFCNKVG